MIRNTTRGAALAAILAAVVAAACGTSAADEAGMGLATVSAEVMDITSAVAATGTIEPIRVIDVKSQASGEVLQVAVELGEEVERGALLVRIDPRDVRNAHDQAVADLDVAEARYTVAQRKLERTANLKDSQVVTEEEYEDALLEQANAKAALVKAKTNLELAADRLNDVAVGAPITGTVVEKTVEEGQIITSAKEVTGGTIMLRMADLNEVQVRTLVDETDIGSIRAGLEAQIKVEAYPDREFSGLVLQIEPQAVVEQNVTLFAVLTRIQNREGLLKPGMNADVEIEVGARNGVLALPNGGIKTVDEARALVDALGLDPGERRVGVALSDPTGTIASPHSVIDRRSVELTEAVRMLCEEHDVERIVVGLPTGLSGVEGPSAEAARTVGTAVAEATGLPVEYQDERFTTVTAEAALLEGGVRRAKRRDVRDKVAAAVILQTYLDRKDLSGDRFSSSDAD